jgi:hypothetical protein
MGGGGGGGGGGVIDGQRRDFEKTIYFQKLSGQSHLKPAALERKKKYLGPGN